jgi:hypothetical protein
MSSKAFLMAAAAAAMAASSANNMINVMPSRNTGPILYPKKK